MIRFDSKNLLNGEAHLNLKAGQFAAFMIRIAGSTGAAAPVIADFGTVKLSGEKGAVFSVPFSSLQIINQMDLGQVESSIGALGGNPFVLSALIVASRTGDGNIFDISDADEMELEVDLNGIVAGNVASGTIKLFGIPQDGIAQYMPEMFIHSPSITAGETDQRTLHYKNISSIYFTNLTNCDTLMIEKDGQVVVNASFAELQAMSNMDSRIESAFTTGIKIDLDRSGSMGEALSDDVLLHIKATSGGVANPTVTVVSNRYDVDTLVRSSALVQAKTERKLKMKKVNSHEVLTAKALS